MWREYKSSLDWLWNYRIAEEKNPRNLNSKSKDTKHKKTNIMNKIQQKHHTEKSGLYEFQILGLEIW